MTPEFLEKLESLYRQSQKVEKHSPEWYLLQEAAHEKISEIFPPPKTVDAKTVLDDKKIEAIIPADAAYDPKYNKVHIKVPRWKGWRKHKRLNGVPVEVKWDLRVSGDDWDFYLLCNWREIPLKLTLLLPAKRFSMALKLLQERTPFGIMKGFKGPFINFGKKGHSYILDYFSVWESLEKIRKELEINYN